VHGRGELDPSVSSPLAEASPPVLSAAHVSWWVAVTVVAGGGVVVALFALSPSPLALVVGCATAVSVLARMPANVQARLRIAVSMPVDAALKAWVAAVAVVAGVGVLTVTGFSGLALLLLLCATSPPVLSQCRTHFPELLPIPSSQPPDSTFVPAGPSQQPVLVPAEPVNPSSLSTEQPCRGLATEFLQA
jgi:hypothetical protein